jgi:hypothetical protein
MCRNRYLARPLPHCQSGRNPARPADGACRRVRTLRSLGCRGALVRAAVAGLDRAELYLLFCLTDGASRRRILVAIRRDRLPLVASAAMARVRQELLPVVSRTAGGYAVRRRATAAVGPSPA